MVAEEADGLHDDAGWPSSARALSVSSTVGPIHGPPRRPGSGRRRTSRCRADAARESFDDEAAVRLASTG